jgi:tetratricopeptide (TPR) repeat protein
MGEWFGGAVIGVLPMPRPVRYRIRMRHPDAARASDAIADRMLPVLLVVAFLLFVIGIRPGMDSAIRFFFIGSALGLLTGAPFVIERRQLRARLRGLPPAADPVAEMLGALGDDAAAIALRRNDPDAAVACVRDMDRDDPYALRIGAMACAMLRDQRAARALALRAVQLDPAAWEVPAQTGLVLSLRGRFGEGNRLLERAAEVSHGHHRAELMLAQGMRLAGRLREAVEAYERASGRRSR